MRLADAIDGYLLSLQASRASLSTVRLYGFMLRRVAGFAARDGRVRLDQLTLEVARRAVIDELERPEEERGPNWKGGDGTAYSMVNALRAFSLALRAEGAPVADMRALRLPSRVERIQPRLAEDEFNRLETVVLRQLMLGGSSRFLIARNLALLSLLTDTGLRAAECCALDVDDVDLQTCTVTVHLGKGEKPRVLSVRDDDPSERDGGPTVRALRDYLTWRTQSFGRTRERAFWLSNRGRRLSPASLRSVLAALCDAAGLESRPPHAFRRGYFSDEYRRRPTALPTLKARMGWSPRSHQMVDVYTRGAEIDLAREQPQPLVSKRWRNGDTRAGKSVTARPLPRLEATRATEPRHQPSRKEGDAS